MTAQLLTSARPESAIGTADLIGRLQRVVHVAERAVSVLGHDGYQDDNSSDGVSGDKVVAETAMLLLATEPLLAANRQLRESVQTVARLLMPLARGERLRAGLCLQPALAADFAFAHICLTRLGFADPSFDRLLAVALAPGSGFRERLPHRALEQTWILSVWDPEHPALSPERTARAIDASMLAGPIDCLGATRDDLYALTHALMYVGASARRPSTRSGGSDGRPGAPGLVRLPRSPAAIAADAEAGLAHCLDRQDYDLAAELLLTWPLLGLQPSPSALFAMSVLTRIEDEVGFLPSAIARADRYRGLADVERRKYALATTYHTAYTMGLLCCALLTKATATFAPPAADEPPSAPAVARRRGAAGPVDHAFDELDRRARTGRGDTPFWLDVYAGLDPAEREQLAPLLLSMTLRSATERRDLAGVHALVGLAHDLHLAALPAVRQAGALLDRCAFLVQP
jgi:hypothetical protein